ncbi:hypothetical protein LR48_Vigan511s007300 [Vigna angularis]|uniref:Tf2-1-like SH3-like domain-containing protein n=1 Tax=Phaseolus angularis TaxID=3914 RepID=A0A0L9TCA6_PHAAN|nr:uncharacterized protein LOC108321401 [Vigna angularis]KOM28250.1 hypothetical protein LR48_Vigan511s007300 [Vigna angularis]
MSWAEYWYNTNFHSSIGTTPFEVVYGRPPPVITRFLPRETCVEAVQRELLDRDEALSQRKQHLLRSWRKSFSIGVWVFLKLKPHRQQTLKSEICPKLAPKYYCPFQITGRLGAAAYRLQLPPESRIHPVFHVSLKRCWDFDIEKTLPPGLDLEIVRDVVPAAVLATLCWNWLWAKSDFCIFLSFAIH